jgi:hypothetical protein
MMSFRASADSALVVEESNNWFVYKLSVKSIEQKRLSLT